jgi:hypothetical protein
MMEEERIQQREDNGSKFFQNLYENTNNPDLQRAPEVHDQAMAIEVES